jgi:two-component system sensor histidine kinase KdpD
VYVRQNALSAEDQVMLERNLKLAEDHNAQVMVIEGDDPMQAVLNFARDHGVTQIFIGHSLGHGLLQRFQRTPVERLIEAANGIDVRIFPQ